MRYCPKCEIEFEDGVETCADCGAALVDRAGFERAHSVHEEILTEPYEKVCTLDDRFEGDVLSHELEARDIRTLVRPYQDAAYDGLFIPQQGWGALYVPERQAAEAREVVEAARSAAARSSDEPPSETPDDA